jgi:4-alpha-glucanotransferase
VPGDNDDAAPSLVSLAWSSVAALTIAPVQDLLNLGAESRMNIPGSASGNWRWRCPNDIECSTAFQWLRELTESSKRVEPEKIQDRPDEEGSSIPDATVSEAV